MAAAEVLPFCVGVCVRACDWVGCTSLRCPNRSPEKVLGEVSVKSSVPECHSAGGGPKAHFDYLKRSVNVCLVLDWTSQLVTRIFQLMIFIRAITQSLA